MGDHSINFADVLCLETGHSAGLVQEFRSTLPLSDKERDYLPEAGQDYKMDWLDYASAVQENERRRIASELHDGLGQMLTILTIELRSAKTAAVACNALAPALGLALERACAGARQAIEELRRSVMNLYPSMLDDLGLVASISSILREARQAQPQLRVVSNITVSDSDVPPALRIVAFRIVQEAVNNALKHADARQITVVFSKCNNCLELIIEDDGDGISPASVQQHRPSSGIPGMIRRVNASGGTIAISSDAGTGTRIGVEWNMKPLC